MNNMNGVPTIEQYNSQEGTPAAVDLLSPVKTENNLADSAIETQTVIVKPEEDNHAIISEPIPSEIPIKPMNFSVGFVSALQSTQNDTRVEAVLAKLNGEKLPLAV